MTPGLVIASMAGTPAAVGQLQGAFLWFAMAMGALSLLTTCVFPMVPITVSYFSNHGSGNVSRRHHVPNRCPSVRASSLGLAALGFQQDAT